MDFKLIWTEPAINDLEAIVCYLVAQNGSENARKIGFAIFNKVQILSVFPEVGGVLVEKDDFCWRKLLFKSWKIAYKIHWEEKAVYIARVWHASRNEVEIS